MPLTGKVLLYLCEHPPPPFAVSPRLQPVRAGKVSGRGRTQQVAEADPAGGRGEHTEGQGWSQRWAGGLSHSQTATQHCC